MYPSAEWPADERTIHVFCYSVARTSPQNPLLNARVSAKETSTPFHDFLMVLTEKKRRIYWMGKNGGHQLTMK